MKKEVIQVTRYQVESDTLPEAFDGKKIIQISDFHNKAFGDGNVGLVSMIRAEAPDLIVITGDLLDSRKPDLDCVLKLLGQVTAFAPTLYVLGNHESRFSNLEELLASIQHYPLTVLRNDRFHWNISGEEIVVSGIDDPCFFGKSKQERMHGFVRQLERLGEGPYRILLSHRPELYRYYQKYGYHLVFSGHAHGGQFRLPGIGGIFAPNQGFFPEYDSGIYSDQDTVMVVSRGLGDSVLPVRVHNCPEMVSLVLRRK